MSKNIFQIWDDIGRITPFAVRRDNWSKKYYAIVEKVEINKFPYGNAYGFSTINGIYSNHFEHDSKWRRKRIIPCCGCYQWTLVEIVDSVEIEKANQTRKKEIVDKLPIVRDKFTVYEQESTLNFGKYKGKTINEIYQFEPTYIEWCIEKINGFAIAEKTINFLIKKSMNFSFKEETIIKNNEKLLLKKKQLDSH